MTAKPAPLPAPRSGHRYHDPTKSVAVGQAAMTSEQTNARRARNERRAAIARAARKVKP